MKQYIEHRCSTCGVAVFSEENTDPPELDGWVSILGVNSVDSYCPKHAESVLSPSATQPLAKTWDMESQELRRAGNHQAADLLQWAMTQLLLGWDLQKAIGDLREKAVKDHFLNTVSLKPGERYQVTIPAAGDDSPSEFKAADGAVLWSSGGKEGEP